MKVSLKKTGFHFFKRSFSIKKTGENTAGVAGTCQTHQYTSFNGSLSKDAWLCSDMFIHYYKSIMKNTKTHADVQQLLLWLAFTPSPGSNLGSFWNF